MKKEYTDKFKDVKYLGILEVWRKEWFPRVRIISDDECNWDIWNAGLCALERGPGIGYDFFQQLPAAKAYKMGRVRKIDMDAITYWACKTLRNSDRHVFVNNAHRVTFLMLLAAMNNEL